MNIKHLSIRSGVTWGTLWERRCQPAHMTRGPHEMHSPDFRHNVLHNWSWQDYASTRSGPTSRPPITLRQDLASWISCHEAPAAELSQQTTRMRNSKISDLSCPRRARFTEKIRNRWIPRLPQSFAVPGVWRIRCANYGKRKNRIFPACDGQRQGCQRIGHQRLD